MAETDGPLQLLEVCERRLSRFLYDAEHKHLAWLREVEEQGLRMLDSNLGAEPELMSKTPSQRRRPRRRQSSCLKEEGKEPGRRRSSRRRSSTKLLLSKPCSQRRLSKLPAQSLCQGAQVPTAGCLVGPQASLGAECPAPTGMWPPGAPAPVVEAPQGAPCEAGTGERVPRGVPAPGLPEASPAAAISTAREEESPGGARAAPARAAGAAGLPGHQSAAGLQDPGGEAAPGRAEPGRGPGQRWSRRSSLAGKCPLGSRRKSLGRRSLGRGSPGRAAARESCPGRASCQSSLEGVVEDVRGSTRPRLEADPPGAEAPEDSPVSSTSVQAAQHPSAQHQQGFFTGSCAKLSSEPQKEKQDPPHCAKPQEKPTHGWTRSCRQAVGALWGRPRAASPLDDKQRSSAHQPPSSSSSSSPAGKVVRPLKSFLQAVQRSQLLASPAPPGQPAGIKGFIRRQTPSRAAVKGDFVERERQRLESLRKKQEAEEQRRKKVEEEKRRRQAEMKQKREERLRKALQAKERVEQMEEEKKRRMEQKMLQSDEKVRPSQPREEKAAEERSRRKASRKLEEAEARKQRAPRREENELEQQEALQKREDEVKGKKVWELRSLVEQRQLEHMKEREHKQRWREKAPPGQLEPVGLTEKSRKEEESPKVLQQLPGQQQGHKQAVKEDALQEPRQLGEEKRIREAEALPAACAMWLSKPVKRSVSASCLESLRGDADNYGMDLNSDDSTDDENDPRKPVPAWAEGSQLNQAVVHQYYHPVDVDQIFGRILSPRLEDIFGKSKPRYFKRTSSAVWTSPPGSCKP